MRESTIGSKAGSHLHWELILQKDDEEIYLGRNMPNPELYHMLKEFLRKRKKRAAITAPLKIFINPFFF